MTTTHRRISASSEARNAIVAQHERLRALVARTLMLADSAVGSPAFVEELRRSAGALYDELDRHLRYEEEVLAAALRDVHSLGASLHDQLTDDHGRQREALTFAIEALDPEALSGSALAHSVRVFVVALLQDVDHEERILLEADVDEMADDAYGG
jgi:hypothetical protein